MTCPGCTPAPGPDRRITTEGRLPTLALVGTPNVGKSTLFNALTGVRAAVRNAPGTTVELAAGTWHHREHAATRLRVLDLPGTYSLVPRSPDERVTRDVLAGAYEQPPEMVVLVIDASEPARSVYLAAHVARTRVPTVVALSLADVARSRGRGVDAVALETVLGVPVVEINPRTGEGLAALDEAVQHLVDHPAPLSGPPGAGTDWSEDALMETAEDTFEWVRTVLDTTALRMPSPAGPWAGGSIPGPHRTLTDRIDRVLLDPLWGLLAGLLVLWALFSVATSVAAPLMEAADTLVSGPVAAAVSSALDAAGWGAGWFESLVVDGVLVGVATVASFAPLMGLMFLAIALLDDSGYLARVALVTDRAMRRLGLDGRAVLALVVGFGCNVPALAATRTLPDRRQRLLVGLLVPYTACAARLTVFVLLATVFFPDHATLVVLAMYVVSVLLVVVSGLVLRATVFRDVRSTPLVIVLPSYQRPRLRSITTATWVRTWGFVRGAGVVVVATLLVVWALLAVPVHGNHQIGAVPVVDSAYGATAQLLAPVFTPAGFGDWHATSALMTGFIAKEVVVGGLAQSYAVAEPAAGGESSPLGDALSATFEQSSGGHPRSAAAAFMIFVLAYTPCLATVAEQARVLGRRTTGLAVAVQLSVAWFLAVVVFQVGRML
ncbi:ferrous iron transporter B [Sanguibacter antarcticus]|uniref:Ferrous iron transport protein B n=1 Tax=Sanguibacter antarcticus TaxID=372484 RepID=A0A2A9E4W2_9MICO|nr:ferrous iron transporter B [Sanguibacter antarcticus]PFG33385.1 ferrous iron transport protein B [Sanguibacter antarcticus]